MAKGGARARSGPAPDPNALRRDRDAGDWVDLPAEGRVGDPPAFPLTRPTKRELELWERHWVLPQAVMWARDRVEYTVAMYVRQLRLAEDPSAPANRATLVRQLMDDLGLTEAGLARNKWRIVRDETEERRQERSGETPSARDRFKVVADGAG